MSNGVGEFLNELPEVERPVVARVPATTKVGGDIVYMKPGDHIRCDCGNSNVRRKADTYEITGPMYHREGWLCCSKCNDRVRIEPKVKFIDGPQGKGV